jgi:hypothetical protein
MAGIAIGPEGNALRNIDRQHGFGDGFERKNPGIEADVLATNGQRTP